MSSNPKHLASLITNLRTLIQNDNPHLETRYPSEIFRAKEATIVRRPSHDRKFSLNVKSWGILMVTRLSIYNPVAWPCRCPELANIVGPTFGNLGPTGIFGSEWTAPQATTLTCDTLANYYLSRGRIPYTNHRYDIESQLFFDKKDTLNGNVELYVFGFPMRCIAGGFETLCLAVHKHSSTSNLQIIKFSILPVLTKIAAEVH